MGNLSPNHQCTYERFENCFCSIWLVSVSKTTSVSVIQLEEQQRAVFLFKQGSAGHVYKPLNVQKYRKKICKWHNDWLKTKTIQIFKIWNLFLFGLLFMPQTVENIYYINSFKKSKKQTNKQVFGNYAQITLVSCLIYKHFFCYSL